MKINVLAITSLLVAGLATSCSSADADPGLDTEKSQTAGQQLDEATADTRAAGRAVKAYAYAEKAAYVAGMKSDLAVIEAEVDRLSAMVDKSNAATKADAKARLAQVRAKWAQAKKDLDRADTATESAWNDVFNAFEAANADLKAAFDDTRQWLSDKIEP